MRHKAPGPGAKISTSPPQGKGLWGHTHESIPSQSKSGKRVQLGYTKKKTSKLSKKANHTKEGDEKRQFHSYRPRRGSDPKLRCQSRPRKDRGTLHRKHFALRILHGPGKVRVSCLLLRGLRHTPRLKGQQDSMDIEKAQYQLQRQLRI